VPDAVIQWSDAAKDRSKALIAESAYSIFPLAPFAVYDIFLLMATTRRIKNMVTHPSRSPDLDLER